jgi:hypothetical protein
MDQDATLDAPMWMRLRLHLGPCSCVESVKVCRITPKYGLNRRVPTGLQAGARYCLELEKVNKFGSTSSYLGGSVLFLRPVIPRGIEPWP